MSYNKETGMYEGFIYCITNKINNRKYIGQTLSTIEHRMSQHFSNNKNKLVIGLAIQKYGKDNFTFEEIAKYESETKEELRKILDEKEIYYIKKYHSLAEEHGYNISKGGNSRDYFGHPVDVYNKQGKYICSFPSISEASRYYEVGLHSIFKMCNGKIKIIKHCDYIFRFKGDNFNKYDTSYTIGGAKKIYQFSMEGVLLNEFKTKTEASKYMSELLGQKCDIKVDRKTYKGYIWSYDKEFDYEKCVNSNKTPVDIYYLDGKLFGSYTSIKDGLKSIGINYSVSSVHSACEGKLFTLYGYVWRYKGDPFDKYPLEKPYANGKPVNQYTKNNEYITTFRACTEAGIMLDIRGKNISACCRGEQKTYKGFKWFYADDPNQPDKSKIIA